MPVDRKTQILVAVIGLIGALGAALFANWDKVVGHAHGTSTGASAPSDTGPKVCRDKSHGIERYARSFTVERTSLWMGGGYSQDPWCNDVIAQQRGQVPDAEFNVLAKSEDKKNTCAPFNCPQYQYYCKVEVHADPIYEEKASSACK